MSKELVGRINNAIAAYFKNNPEVDWIAAKEIMADLVKAGIFNKDEKKGLPLRKVFRALDKEKALDKIPFIHAERRGIDTYWYLVREGAQYIPKETVPVITNKQKRIAKRQNSDEYYLIGLCNELLGEKASHQHTFSFLLGDFHKDKKTRTRLPIDAYYPKLNVAIEFFEREDLIPTDDLDKAEEMTVSRVSRKEQRKKYTERKREVLLEKEIGLVEMDYDEFECDNQNKLVRNKEADMKLLKEILKDFVK